MEAAAAHGLVKWPGNGSESGKSPLTWPGHQEHTDDDGGAYEDEDEDDNYNDKSTLDDDDNGIALNDPNLDHD